MRVKASGMALRAIDSNPGLGLVGGGAVASRVCAASPATSAGGGESQGTRDLESLLRRDAAEIDQRLNSHFDGLRDIPETLLQAMRYSVEAGGKRLRPVLVLWSCEAAGGDRAAAWPAALAIECAHTFSLIHDDLPAIDNDDLRRGRPTSHVRFGESTAILAGDGLLAHAFEIVSSVEIDPVRAAAWTRELAAAIGPAGVIGGEVSDLAGEKLPPSAELVRSIHLTKTARLIESACRLGAIAAGASAECAALLASYGRDLGQAFQAADDLLDETGDVAKMGKRVGKDAASGKQTWSRAVGVEAARRMMHDLADRAIAAVAPLGGAGSALAELARYVVRRES